MQPAAALQGGHLLLQLFCVRCAGPDHHLLSAPPPQLCVPMQTQSRPLVPQVIQAALGDPTVVQLTDPTFTGTFFATINKVGCYMGSNLKNRLKTSLNRLDLYMACSTA
jgi:hypothetical protein